MQFLILALFFLQPWPQPRPPALAQRNATDEFAPVRREWAEDLKAKRIDAAVALYAADATLTDPDGSCTRGTGAIRELFQAAAQTYDSDVTFEPQRVEDSGELAVDSGTYRETVVVRATGKQIESEGSYLMVYRREGGVWKIVEQVWTGKQPD